MYCGTVTFMAPEVAKVNQGQTYNKSVDIWALGIILHIAITGGKHPFLESGDDYNTFREKLKTIKNVQPDKSLSHLA